MEKEASENEVTATDPAGGRASFERLGSALELIAREAAAPLAYRVAPTLYFKAGGVGCTDMTLEAALIRAEELGLLHMVVASTTGLTARRALHAIERHAWQGRLTVVTEHTGYHAPGVNLFPEAERRLLEERGVRVHTASHAFSSVARSFRIRWQGIEMLETVAESFRRISRGTKVALEASIMAADAGLVPIDTDIIAVGGTSRGCDTAVVVRATTMNYFFDLKVREFVALPMARDQELGITDKGTPQGAVQKSAG